MGGDWTELTPMGEEGGEERLRKAQEEFLRDLTVSEPPKRSVSVGWVILLGGVVIALLVWNLSLRRALSQKDTPSGQRATQESARGQKGKAPKGGIARGTTPLVAPPSPSAVSSPFPPREAEQGQKERPKASPTVPFPLPVYEPSQRGQAPSLPSPPSALRPNHPPLEPPHRLPMPPSLTAPTVAFPMGSFDLPQVVGLVITDKGRLALLKVGARTVSVTVGEKIPGTGWEVRAIEPEGVALVFSEGQREKVVLRPAF